MLLQCNIQYCRQDGVDRQNSPRDGYAVEALCAAKAAASGPGARESLTAHREQLLHFGWFSNRSWTLAVYQIIEFV
jgi:hypothetical protein